MVLLTVAAQADFEALPLTIRARVATVFERLAAWPAVSGAKPLRGDMAGTYRIRTGDWRLLFQIQGGDVLVTRIAHRRDVYED